MATTLQDLRFDARTLLAEQPRLYFPFVRLTHPAGPGKVLGTDTEIVIEGFTRSANTFATVAFQMAQPRPTRVARHLHSPAQIREGVRRGLPVLVPARAPRPTVISSAIRAPQLSLKHILWSYARFYEKIAPVRDGFVAARFEDITTDMGAVILRVNQRFGTAFAPFEHTAENVAECFAIIDQRTLRPPWIKAVADFQSGLIGAEQLRTVLAGEGPIVKKLNEDAVARPSAAREDARERLGDEYERPELDVLRKRAERAFELVAGG
jgi:hypothetical protein